MEVVGHVADGREFLVVDLVVVVGHHRADEEVGGPGMGGSSSISCHQGSPAVLPTRMKSRLFSEPHCVLWVMR